MLTNCNIVNTCKKIIRESDNLIRVNAIYRENVYYNTEIFPVTNGENEIFTLRVEIDSDGAWYTLSLGNYEYNAKNWLQKRKMNNLRRLLKRKAAEQKRMLMRVQDLTRLIRL